MIISPESGRSPLRGSGCRSFGVEPLRRCAEWYQAHGPSVSSRADIPNASAKIRLFIDDAHVANVLRVRRELCIGETVR